MHKLFTSYHTTGVILFYAILMSFLYIKYPTIVRHVFSKNIFIKITVIGFLTVCSSSFYRYDFHSGMNKITVLGWPRGFFQIVNTKNSLVTKSLLYRYLFEDFLLFTGAYVLIFAFFKFLTKK